MKNSELIDHSIAMMGELRRRTEAYIAEIWSEENGRTTPQDWTQETPSGWLEQSPWIAEGLALEFARRNLTTRGIDGYDLNRLAEFVADNAVRAFYEHCTDHGAYTPEVVRQVLRENAR